ncbi:Alpha/Beta hydrolase protein [Schizophyllum fasciatum]
MRYSMMMPLAATLAMVTGAMHVPQASQWTRRAAGIDWLPCSDLDPTYSSGDANVACGFYEVPLDWADEAVGTAKLAVALYPATQERRGSIFVNPGGPGGSGVEFLLQDAANISITTGGHYDIVSWDPRGSDGSTIPGPPTCFDSPQDFIEYFSGTLEATGLEIRGHLSDDDQIAEFYSHVDEMEAKYRGLGQRCAEGNNSKVLQYIGTAATARDMVALADYFDPDVQEINYWGFSYGTMLGFTFVHMFPDRVGRVILDGCMDPILYTDKPSTQYVADSLKSAEETFAGFTAACALAGKDGCRLVESDNETAEDIAQRFQDLLDLAHDLTESGADMSGIPTSAEARADLYSIMYFPALWDAVAGLVRDWQQALEATAANATVPEAIAAELSQFKRGNTTTLPFGLLSIYCGDAVDAGNMTMRDGFDSIVWASENVSPLFGPQWDVPGNVCFAWPARAVERYTGPWGKTLKNPILIIGNTADPVTPFENAQLMADLLDDSAVLVKQDGLGHTTLAEKSSCIVDIVNKYFTDGSLPEGDDTQCEIDDSVILFPNSSVTQASVRLSLLATTAIEKVFNN